MEVPNDILFAEVEEQLSTGCSVTINVRGFSMNPFIDGDRDAVELANTDNIRVGDVALAHLTAGNYVLHRVFAVDGDMVTLMGDGNVQGKELCRRDQIVAIALKVIKPSGRVVRLDDSKAFRRAGFWLRLLPIRRYLLAVYRHFILPLKRRIREV